MTPILGVFSFLAIISCGMFIFLHTKAGKRWMKSLDK